MPSITSAHRSRAQLAPGLLPASRTHSSEFVAPPNRLVTWPPRPRAVGVSIRTEHWGRDTGCINLSGFSYSDFLSPSCNPALSTYITSSADVLTCILETCTPHLPTRAVTFKSTRHPGQTSNSQPSTLLPSYLSKSAQNTKTWPPASPPLLPPRLRRYTPPTSHQPHPQKPPPPPPPSPK